MDHESLILTLDGGGTTFNFAAVRNSKPVGQIFSLPAHAHDLDLSLDSMVEGFSRLIKSTDHLPKAISIAFPGPADYKNGVIGNAPNLPAYRGGVALGPFLQDQFNLPVFINNDGDLFTLGESTFGMLPYVNKLLEESGQSMRYHNLIGITLGSGLGAGITVYGKVLTGDNNAAAEGWKIRNKRHSYTGVEDTVSSRSLQRMYAEQIAIDPSGAPEPAIIYDIAMGRAGGVREAAVESYLRYGEVLGDAIAHLITMADGLVVIGGGISGAYPLFSRSMFDELNSHFIKLNGKKDRRLIQQVFDLESKYHRELFLNDESKEVSVPRSSETVKYRDRKKTGVGLSRLGTSEAIALGAFQFAIGQL